MTEEGTRVWRLFIGLDFVLWRRADLRRRVPCQSWTAQEFWELLIV